MRKRIFGFVVALVLFLTVFGLVACYSGSTQGIPHGAYSRLDNQGNTINEGAEGTWTIRKDEAEHRYLKFSIVKIDGKIYFEIERVQAGSLTEAESGLFRYEANYNEKMKILTVSMPSNDGTPHCIPTTAFELKEFQFMKAGINIG